MAHRSLERGPAAVMLRDQVRRSFAHMADAKRKDQPRQGNFAFILNGLKQFIGRFLAPAFAVLELLHAAAIAGL